MIERPIAPLSVVFRRGFFRACLQGLVIGLVLVWTVLVIALLGLRWINPPTTAVRIERFLQAWIEHKPYRADSVFVPLDQISPDLQHAVIAAEDARFYQHHGFDWQQIESAAEQDLDGGRLRGASTLTQQLVKNLFLGTSRSVLRKGLEFMLVPMAELVLGKRRILELYLNVVEWGPGIYGAESACRAWDRTSARRMSRNAAARLAAILPAPLTRRPERMNRYSATILERMRQMGW